MSRCRARQHHNQAVSVAPDAAGAVKMSQPDADRRTLSRSAPPLARSPEDPLTCIPQVRIGFVTRSGVSLRVKVGGASDGELDAIVTRFAR